MPKAVKGTKGSYLYGWVYVTALVPRLLYTIVLLLCGQIVINTYITVVLPLHVLIGRIRFYVHVYLVCIWSVRVSLVRIVIRL